VLTHGRNRADDFVSGNERELADAPVVGDQMNIASTNAAVRHADLNLIETQVAWVISERQKLCARRVCCKSLNDTHVVPQSSLGLMKGAVLDLWIRPEDDEVFPVDVT
jgi:hypothetical protein